MIAIAAVAGTLALIAWMIVLFVKKDRDNDVTGNRR
jgi:hypothetical protein